MTSIKKLTEYKNVSGKDVEDEPCQICIDDLKQIGLGVIKCTKCKKQFHKKCWKKAIKSDPKCPNCRHNFTVNIVPDSLEHLTTFSQIQGPQPHGGTMGYSISNYVLSGYPNTKTIVISYVIPGGLQDQRHPNPGTRYNGDVRKVFLPFNEEGLRIYERFQRAFMFGHMFTVGSSLTRSIDNVIIWNGIHQKTSSVPGAPHGFPDPAYFHNVDMELKTKGF
jgi:deltex-like protein